MLKSSALEKLKSIDFNRVGEWVRSGEKGISLHLETILPHKESAVYAFVADGDLKYIGSTELELTKRIRHYAHPGPTQKTNQRIKQLILETLSRDLAVEIYAWHDDCGFQVGEFNIVTALGLEPTLIKKFNPAWNKKGASK